MKDDQSVPGCVPAALCCETSHLSRDAGNRNRGATRPCAQGGGTAHRFGGLYRLRPQSDAEERRRKDPRSSSALADASRDDRVVCQLIGGEAPAFRPISQPISGSSVFGVVRTSTLTSTSSRHRDLLPVGPPPHFVRRALSRVTHPAETRISHYFFIRSLFVQYEEYSFRVPLSNGHPPLLAI